MKKKIVYICALFLIITPFLYAQHAIGSWQNHLSYHNVTRTEPAGNLIYAIGNGSLFSYDKEDTSIQCYWKGNLLSDTDISYIAYNKEYKTLIIIYSNANIDLLVNDKEVYNLPDYMNKNMIQTKNVNHICFAKEYAYLSTSFGVMVLNLKKREIANTYILNKKINACAVDDTKIYAASSEGLLTGLLTDNLLDNNNWNKVSDNVYAFLSIHKDKLIGDFMPQSIGVINKENYNYSPLVSGYYNFMYNYNGRLIASNESSFTFFDEIDKPYYYEHYLNIAPLSYENGIYWTGGSEDKDSERGLMGIKFDLTNKSTEIIVSPIIPNSPKRNLNYCMKFEGERLLVTGGGNTNRDNEGTIMMLENNIWSSFQEKGIYEKTGILYRNISSIVQDPTDEKRHFASSVTQGLYEFYDKLFIKHYTYNNSPLEVALPITSPGNFKNFVRINGLIYDNSNNLWMLNCEVKNPIHVLKPNNEWVNLSYPEIANTSVLENTIIDKRGWLWATSSLMTNYGVFCLNTNNTLEDTGDDRHKFVTNFINQDGTLLSHKNIYCIAEDKNGIIWIGTAQGPIILNNPSNFFEDNFYCTQIKVPRNDGTNLADFLLANDEITAIAVDGGNRKWIGTSANGIYLLSSDGLETIHHFTAENSPLLSNDIQTIAINPYTGEVFIGTSKGIISYQSDAIEPKDSFVDDDVYAYPNPVKQNYTGVITITGLMMDTDIKITNVSGKLIYAGTSVGGQFTWNGRNLQGNKVPSGIYFVLAADKDGKQSIATKILIVK